MKTTDSDTIEVQASPEVIYIYVNGVKQNLNKINEFRGQLRKFSYLIQFRWKPVLLCFLLRIDCTQQYIKVS